MDVWTPGPISIHAPREGCDLCLCRRLTSTITISIHAPREGCDVITKFRRSLERDFNPRTPRGVRREVLDNGVVVHGNSNPRTPRGVRPRRKGLHWITDRFQSTHPARGATAGSWPTTSPNANFNPRTPRGVRRPGAGRLHHQMPISIHAPREGCDGIGVPAGHDPLLHFNPRTPRGVRLGPQMILTRPPVFQSTHPARGATWHEAASAA